jgi:hypothetical protein
VTHPASALESCHRGISWGSSTGQKNAPICTSTCAAHTAATNCAPDKLLVFVMSNTICHDYDAAAVGD